MQNKAEGGLGILVLGARNSITLLRLGSIGECSLYNLLGKAGGCDEEVGAGIDGECLGAVEADSVRSINFDTGDRGIPEEVAASALQNVSVLNVSSEKGVVDATKDNLAATVVGVHVHREDRRRNQALLVEVNVDSVVSISVFGFHGSVVRVGCAEDTIKEEFRVGRLLSSWAADVVDVSQSLLLHGSTADSNAVSEVDTVSTAGTVGDVQVVVGFFEGGRRGRIEEAFANAALRVIAAFVGNPSIGTAGIEQKIKVLSRSTDGNWNGVLLQVKVVQARCINGTISLSERLDTAQFFGSLLSVFGLRIFAVDGCQGKSQ